MDTFKYKIINFDREGKFVDVSFEDGSWAKVMLIPYPSNESELAALIAPFAPSLEAINSVKADSSVLNFIQDMVGRELSAARLALPGQMPQGQTPTIPVDAPEAAPPPSDPSLIDKARIKQVVYEVLAEIEESKV